MDNAFWLRQSWQTGDGLAGRWLREDGSHAAWLLAVHAPDPQLQRECLRLLGEAVRVEQAAEEDWATLLDRVLVNEGRAQVLGTQPTTKDRTYRPQESRQGQRRGAGRAHIGDSPCSLCLGHAEEPGAGRPPSYAPSAREARTLAGSLTNAASQRIAAVSPAMIRATP